MALTLVNLNTSPSATLVTLNTSPSAILSGSWAGVASNWESETKTWKQIGMLGKDSD